jgi:hypothetical protein
MTQNRQWADKWGSLPSSHPRASDLPARRATAMKIARVHHEEKGRGQASIEVRRAMAMMIARFRREETGRGQVPTDVSRRDRRRMMVWIARLRPTAKGVQEPTDVSRQDQKAWAWIRVVRPTTKDGQGLGVSKGRRLSAPTCTTSRRRTPSCST